MARRFFRKLAALAKVETSYGTDAGPTAGANAIQLSNVTLTPIEGERVSRDLILPYFGDQGFKLAATYARVEFSVEMFGAGAAGTVPAYGPLLRGCALAQAVTAGSRVEYKPVSSEPEALSLYFNMDGVNHALLGARGNLTLSVAPRQIPRFTFNMSGLLGPIADTPLPVASYATWREALVANKANTTFALHGIQAPMESFSLDLGNQVAPRMLVGSESIEITDRKSSGNAVIEALALAQKNWFDTALTSALGSMLLTHGANAGAGNIVEIAASAVQIGQPTYGQTDGITNTSLPLVLRPASGDDELTIRVR